MFDRYCFSKHKQTQKAMVNLIKSYYFFVFHIISFCLFFDSFYVRANGVNAEDKQSAVGIGVVQDPSSSFWIMANLCMDMAISDFYADHPDYRTRLQLHKKDARSVIDVKYAVLELVEDEEVIGILGPHGSIEETFAAAVGKSVKVPIISFTARSSGLSYNENRYFVRTTSDDAFQAQAIADIFQRFNWTKVAILYEDTHSGNQLLSHLIKAFKNPDIKLSKLASVPTSAEDSHIFKILNDTKETKVFLVHMNPEFGFRLFSIANKAGMMSEGYAWVITDSLSIYLYSIDPDTRDSMDGVLGVRPYVSNSKKLTSFKERWKRNMLVNNSGSVTELNMYGYWAYDTVTALAIAIENMGSNHNITGLRVSSLGPRLLNELSSTRFKGLTGDFQLVDGRLKSSTLEILNVIGTGERRVGFWTPGRGITKELSSASNEVKTIMWPGDSVNPPSGIKLRVVVPWKPGFKVFVNASTDPKTNRVDATGFCIDIFRAALDMIPFQVKYEFHCYNRSTSTHWAYDEMLHEIYAQKYDMVVADTTIWGPRAEYVDFSVPYSESGVVLVVKNKKPLDIWIFIRPLRWDLWLAIFVACILIGGALSILERGEESSVTRPGTTYWSPIAILAFQERNMVSNSWSVFVLVCWLFVAFILMQSFTANLSASLTVDQLNFAYSRNHCVGYHTGSFMKDFLMTRLNIKESRLKAYNSSDQFHDAMSKGCKNGGVDVILDEVPYMKIFLKRYDRQYRMVGQPYPTSGFGFAFPKGSPLVAHFTRAIMNVTQGPQMNSIEQKNFGPGYSSQDPLSSVVSQGSSSLTLREFAGLFVVVGAFTLLALFCSETPIGRKLTALVGRFIRNNCYKYSHGPQRVHSMGGEGNDEHETRVEGERNDDSTEEDVNSPPAAREGGDIQLIRRDDEQIQETTLLHETCDVQE